VDYRLTNGQKCCRRAFCIEQDWDDRFIRRMAHIEFQGEDDHGAGGPRIPRVLGMSSSEHSAYVSIPRMRASAWFAYEKAHVADQAPNALGNGIYQIDRIPIKEYYEQFLQDMEDLHYLSPLSAEIPSQAVWEAVWKENHSDLVMRVSKDVDHKDKIRENLRKEARDLGRAGSPEKRSEIRALRAVYRRTIAEERAYYYREIQYACMNPRDNLCMIIDGASQE